MKLYRIILVGILMISGWNQLRYHKTQAALWNCPKRFIFVPAGRQSGKTVLGLRKLVRHLPIKKPWDNPRYVYSAPTFNQAKRIGWKMLLSLIPKHWLADVSVSELRIETVFGSELRIVGLDTPQRLEGDIGGIDGIMIDEYSDVQEDTFGLTVLPMLAHRNGWAQMSGIPKRHGVGAKNYHKQYLSACSGEMPDAAGFTWPSIDIMAKEQVDIARTILDDYSFREQYEATWLSASGGVFHSFDKDYNVRPCIYNPDKPILVASDFNVNPLCWLFCHLRGDILEVFDELFLRDTNTPSALKVMLGRYPDHKGGWQMYGDASSRGRHTSAYETDYNHLVSDMTLRAMGRTMHYLKSNPPIADRFACTNSRICAGDGTISIYIDPRNEHLITDLEVRSYKPGTRETADTGDVGHATDALGYLCYRKWSLKLRLPKSNTIIITKGTS